MNRENTNKLIMMLTQGVFDHQPNEAYLRTGTSFAGLGIVAQVAISKGKAPYHWREVEWNKPNIVLVSNANSRFGWHAKLPAWILAWYGMPYEVMKQIMYKSNQGYTQEQLAQYIRSMA